jgi:hypothetical protein
MKITSVSVRYSELRSTGYPNFSNKTCGIELSANLDSGDTAVIARDRLYEAARTAVAKMFAQSQVKEALNIEINEMTIPF